MAQRLFLGVPQCTEQERFTRAPGNKPFTESLPSRFGHDVADRVLVHQVWQALGSLHQVRGTGGSSFPPAAIPITLEQAHL